MSATAVRLPANPVPVYYAGGHNIDRFRRTTSASPRPEDWVGSTAALPAAILPPGPPADAGVSRLPDGRSLRDAVRDDRAGWLGPELASRFAGGETGLLVKLLDAGERLPVHAHPDRDFARRHLASPFGKTEGWIVMDDAPGGDIWLGFRNDVPLAHLRAWIERQAVDEMLGAMNRLTASPGDVFFVPAGVPHAIGPGVMIAELQEPTSFSILAEFAAFGLDARQATLGLGWEAALGCFDRRGYPPERLALLRPSPTTADLLGARVSQLFGPTATPFFQALRVEVVGRWRLPRSFLVLIVESGSGALETGAGKAPVAAGETWLVPFGTGPVTLAGRLRCLVCLPPSRSPE